MARTPLVAGNWKMNHTAAQGAAMVELLFAQIAGVESVEIVICPTYLTIPKLHDQLRNNRVQLGAQNVFWKDSGAFTGLISVPMLMEMGVTHCIVGHSETRGRFGTLEISESTVSLFAETDETVRLKIHSLLAHGLVPILCVGETLAEREAGNTDSVIEGQLAGALMGIDEVELAPLVVAYEPVWAIGTGKTCETEEAERISAMIRDWIGRAYSPDFADGVRVLYGGSVKPSNARELFHQPNIDGGLVGGASLKADDFAAVIKAAV